MFWATARFPVAVAALAFLMAGCVSGPVPGSVSCDVATSGPGDVALTVTGQDLAEEGYRWADAERNVTLLPVMGGTYPKSTEHDATRQTVVATIPPGDCVAFSGLAPGWYEVDTAGVMRPSPGLGCGWYDADPKHIEVLADRINEFTVRASFACP